MFLIINYLSILGHEWMVCNLQNTRWKAKKSIWI